MTDKDEIDNKNYLDLFSKLFGKIDVYEGEVTQKNNRRSGSKMLVDDIRNFDDSSKCKTDLTCMKETFEKALLSEASDTHIEGIMRLIAKIFQKIITNLNTRQQKFTELVNKTKKYRNNLHGKAKGILVLNKDDKIVRIKSHSKSLAKKHDNLVEFTEKEVLEAQKISMKGSTIQDRVIALQLACGARLIEILKASKFEMTEDPHEIKVIGVAKQRTVELANKTIVRCLIGMTSKQFMDKYDELQNLANTTGTLADITNRFVSRTIKRIKELFPNHPISGSHILRKIWVNMSYPLCKNKKQTLNSYASKMLGHHEDNLGTSLAYTNIRVVREDNVDKLSHQLSKLELRVKDNEKKQRSRNVRFVEQEEDEFDLLEKDVVIGPDYPTDLIDISLGFKMRKNPRKRDGKALQRLDEAMRVLQENNIKATASLLARLGFGRKTIQEHKRGV
jgi:hypothetical protein